MIPKMDIALNDFSGGELNPDAKRMNGTTALTGGRVMRNWRILNSRKLKNRPGRRVILPVTQGWRRVEEIALQTGDKFKIGFGPNALSIIDNTTGAVIHTFFALGSGATIPWVTVADIYAINFDILGKSIYVCFGHAMRPQVVSWDGVSTWSIADYAELVGPSGQKRTPFYRISPRNVTAQPSHISGAITVKFSSPIVVAGMVGTRIRYTNRQILLGSVIDASNINATVIETLPNSQIIAFAVQRGNFALGDVVEGSVSNSKGIVIATPGTQTVYWGALVGSLSVGDAVSGAPSGAVGHVIAVNANNIAVALNTGSTSFTAFDTVTGPSGNFVAQSVDSVALVVQLLDGTATGFVTSDVVAGPTGAISSISSITNDAPKAIGVWDEEVMNDYRGYPASVFVDQFRVGFCDFKALPGGIGWSAINSSSDLYVDATTAESAIFEIAPNKVRVLYVVPGPEGSEFVFCDNRIYYIPISVNNPLKPGSVAFNQISADGCYQVLPRAVGKVLIYIPAGGLRVAAVVAIGQTNRPYDISDLSELSSHLLSSPVAIAIPTSDATFSERYAYVLNNDGTLAVGKYTLDEQQQLKGDVGWVPWSGFGNIFWVSALGSDVILTTAYSPNGVGPVLVVEQLDDTIYLDGAMFVNAAPASMAPPGGKGPFWWIPGGAVDLMDQGTRTLGTYQIDANGFLIPQFTGGEDLTVSTLIGGQPWNATYEPFIPHAPPGQDSQQRMRRRRVAKANVNVQQSSGFVFGTRRVPAYFQGDDATKPPPLRESSFQFRPRGRDYDPRKQLVKDTSGPLIVVEVGLEVTS